MRKLGVLALALGAVALVAVSASAHLGPRVESPKLIVKPVIDGDLSDWEDFGWNADGVWDFDRFQAQPWFSQVTGVLDSGEEPPGTALTAADVSSEYFSAWDDQGLYMGVKRTDNVHDTANSENDPSRWYFKDSCSWYYDVPHDGDGSAFIDGDNVCTFVSDDTYPADGTWWRHGEAGEYKEVPGLPGWQYAVAIDPVSGTNFVIEAFVPYSDFFWVATPGFRPAPGVIIGGHMIVDTDPDGGTQDWGGQLVWGGTGDDDGQWADYIFLGPVAGQVAVESTSWAEVKSLFK